MSAARSKETQNALRDLFSGKPELRERALLCVPAEDREIVRQLAKERQNAMLLIDVMLADLRFASGSMRKDFQNQFWRRTAIRALASTIDGSIYALKQVALASAQLTRTALSDDETEFLSEKPLSPLRRKPRLPPFREHFKQAFKLFAKAHGGTCRTDFGLKDFDALCETFELRHRVTHPKTFMTFGVNDDETNRAGAAIDWFYEELRKLFAACDCALDARSAALDPKSAEPS
jgi:hypothetical protein